MAYAGSRLIAGVNSEGDLNLQEIMPLASHFTAVEYKGKVVYYKAYNKENKIIGAVFKTQGQGYAGPIECIAGVTLSGEITMIRILSQHETPWLGGRVTEPKFTDRFKDRPIEEINDIQTIAGATVSSRAVKEAVRGKAEEILGLMSGG